MKVNDLRDLDPELELLVATHSVSTSLRTVQTYTNGIDIPEEFRLIGEYVILWPHFEEPTLCHSPRQSRDQPHLYSHNVRSLPYTTSVRKLAREYSLNGVIDTISQCQQLDVVISNLSDKGYTQFWSLNSDGQSTNLNYSVRSEQSELVKRDLLSMKVETQCSVNVQLVVQHNVLYLPEEIFVV